jgi:hypothetical protein
MGKSKWTNKSDLQLKTELLIDISVFRLFLFIHFH